jgi:putative sigma-54 modulation protein
MMNIQVEAPFQVRDNLQKLIEDKVTKFTQYFERITTAQVYLKNVEKRRQHAGRFGKVVEIRLEIPRHSLYADASAESFEKALADAADKITRQLQKYKQQMSDYQNR